MGSVMDQDRDGLFDHKGPPPRHSDDIAVDRFAGAMIAKLAAARRKGRGGWDRKDECTAADLSRMLRAHVEKGDPVDVANFCMMLQERGERIEAAPNAHADLVEALRRSEEMNTRYAEYIRYQVKADDLETHPYLPELEDVIASSRAALNKVTQP